MILNELITLAEIDDASLNPGASELEVDSLETLVEVDLPDDYWTFLHEHDGQRVDADTLLGHYRLMSIDEMEMMYTWGLKNDNITTVTRADLNDPRAKEGLLWRPGWLFFARQDTDGIFLVMDFSPTEEGKIGQIFEHHYEEPYFRVLANDFGHLVEITADQIRAGKCLGRKKRARYDRLDFSK